jgi:large subunit ribosomal protein L30
MMINNNLPEQKKEQAGKSLVNVSAKKPIVATVAVAAKIPAQTAVGSPPIKPTIKSSKRLALILIRGVIRAKEDIIVTLYTLRLRKKNACAVIADTPSLRAAAVKCKDYIAYGEIDDETYRLLVEKRGKKNKDGSLKKFFALHPPRGGFDRKGIKTPFTNGGALGNRGAKINDLIKRML